MKTLVIIALLSLGACTSEKPKYSFQEYVRFQNKGFYYCEAYIRNPLPFGYYQVDNVWCQTEHGAQGLSSKILAEGELQKLWEREKGYAGYVYGSANHLSKWNERYFNVEGKWERALTHIVNGGMK